MKIIIVTRIKWDVYRWDLGHGVVYGWALEILGLRVDWHLGEGNGSRELGWKMEVGLAIGLGRLGLMQVVGFRQNEIWLGSWDIGARIGVGPK